MKTVSTPALLATWQRVKATWAAASTTQRRLSGAALALALLAWLWWTALSPALNTLRSASTQHQALDAQLLTLRALALETASLQAMPRVKNTESVGALDQLLRQDLGLQAKLSVVGERATVTLKDLPPDTLVRWLVQTRQTARVKPAELHLTLNAQRTAWDGSVVLLLPPP